MNKRIFRSMVAVSAMVLLVCVICITSVLYGYFGDIIRDELKEEASIISQEVQKDHDYLTEINSIKNRVTLVSADGTVLYDSEADAGSMENHLDREEISGAIENGEAYSTRFSDTLSTKTIYYAKLLDDGSVLRLAQEQSMVMLLLRGIIRPVILIMFAIIILAFIVSEFISRKIVNPVNDLDLSDPEAEEPYPELAPLITKIRQQNRHIAIQLDEMQRKQKEFMAIMENMSEGFLMIDKNMEILSYNSAAFALLGSSVEDRPNTAFELNRSASFRHAIESALSGEHDQQPFETENGSYNIIANPVIEEGKIMGAVVIIVDVTEKEQRERLRREFTSNVSHELKTPLTTIYGVSDMMAEGLVKPADVKSFGRNIREESSRMISLIDDIIKLSKLDEDSFPEEIVSVDLLETAKDVIERLTIKAEEKGIGLYLEGEHVSIKGIPSLCGEIIYNLCENAIKYNKDNGNVMISVTGKGGKAVLTVEDTGIGIPFEYRERIFERFFRIDKSHSQQVDGTGLGLSIVKHAVSHMGGSIEVESTEGKGTKITVMFPEE